MLFDPRYFPYFCGGCLAITAFLFICTGYAYRVNARRPKDDPDKRDFHFGAIFLATFGWVILLPLYAGLFLMRAAVFAVFLILTTFALVVIRKPFLVVLLQKIATKTGNRLLEMNTALIHAFVGRKTRNPVP